MGVRNSKQLSRFSEGTTGIQNTCSFWLFPGFWIPDTTLSFRESSVVTLLQNSIVGDFVKQITPFGIEVFYQFEFPGSPPALDASFSFISSLFVVMHFVPDERFNTVFPGEACHQTFAMSVDATRQ